MRNTGSAEAATASDGDENGNGNGNGNMDRTHLCRSHLTVESEHRTVLAQGSDPESPSPSRGSLSWHCCNCVNKFMCTCTVSAFPITAHQMFTKRKNKGSLKRTLAKTCTSTRK